MSSPVLLVFASAIVLAACETPPPPLVTPPPAPAASTPTPSQDRPLGVAVAVGSPTATPELVGDYATLVRPRLERVRQGLGSLDQQLSVLIKTPLRMADADWRNQLQDTLDDLAAVSLDLRGLSSRVGNQTALHTEVMQLLDDVDFVVSEYHMTLDYDPDNTHFVRAGRARKTATDELQSILRELQQPTSPAPSPAFAP